ncbi:hypothetical protein [Burkholderia anthina]|uniref:hypothetical protein n=1 Tax=Burkholderia anthina TaxID=179879 RepID=UPI00158BCFB3|nr:hypothetical protein [Burkholderia anthina]
MSDDPCTRKRAGIFIALRKSGGGNRAVCGHVPRDAYSRLRVAGAVGAALARAGCFVALRVVHASPCALRFARRNAAVSVEFAGSQCAVRASIGRHVGATL